MGRKEYGNKIWSERKGDTLEYGKGSVSKTIQFKSFLGLDAKFNDVNPHAAKGIVAAGKNPKDYCQINTDIVPRILISEIKKCYEYSKYNKNLSNTEKNILEEMKEEELQKKAGFCNVCKTYCNGDC
jgi:hypothetical protein